MSREAVGQSEELQQYIAAHSEPPDAVQRDLIEATSALGPAAAMQIGTSQGALLEVLVGALRPSFAVEIGTFTGYSALAIARGLPPEGRLLCCDVSEEWTAIARDHWQRAGVADRIDLRIGPASDTLASLPEDQQVDFAFIDADKPGYVGYYEALVPRLGPGGLIAVDNTLWSGQVLDEADTSDDTVALRAFNDHVAADPRTIVALTPVGDGVTFIRRR